MIRFGIPLVVFGIWVGVTDLDPPRPSNPPPAEKLVDYSRDIAPVLASKCFQCHSGDAGRKSRLRLDIPPSTQQAQASGNVAIRPGRASESELVRRIHSRDEDEIMPPPTFKKALTEDEKSLLVRWINQGADYKRHWSFLKPTKPPIPARKNAWIRNEIDAFILAKLESQNLTPAPRADRETLIRRVSLDLRGLPPTIAEIDEFLADGSSNADEKMVDRMLASPHYGEKMAILWMDLARFGDTSGYHQDSTRQMWIWRDWVIAAFNRNMPFDAFSIEQLAGDLLPSATQDQKIASGFNRNTRFNEEGGVDPEEYVLRYHVDRTNTLGQVWLGLTLACAECHSHKTDPISQKEYYQLFAYFSGIIEPMVSMNHGQPLPPILRLPTPEQTAELERLRKEVKLGEQILHRSLDRIKYLDPLVTQNKEDPSDSFSAKESQSVWEAGSSDNKELPKDVQAALLKAKENRSDAEKKTLRTFYLLKVHAPTRELLGTLDQETEEARKKADELDKAIPYTMICEEMAEPRPVHVLRRGDFQDKGEKVERNVPEAFAPLPRPTPANRLGLARWLFHPEHPLTARVTVNRLWAQMFGQGLVRSLGDFGTQGDFPSHPELLDWLAIQFRESGWDVKSMLRRIALSATYQQSSTVSAEREGGRSNAARIDPTNRLLARAPRFRLCAEEVRDGALRAAGLLTPKIGGASVMPYQPEDFFRGKYEAWQWFSSPGEEQHRRGLYTFWRRTSLHPMFTIFDAPSREECVVARSRTNTPLQALVTLNDPTFVEAARVFSERVLLNGPNDVNGRIDYAFRRALSRKATSRELAIVRSHVEAQLKRFQADPDAASKLVNVGMAPRSAQLNVVEHAAWTTITSMILNLDEMVMRE